MTNTAIKNYIDLVKFGKIIACREQYLLIAKVERAFNTENISVNEEQLNKYFNLQKYFPFDLFPWEKFCFALKNCVYRSDGQLRWPNFVLLIGRGAGKNGFESFDDFCLLTPIHGVRKYNIDIFANSEKQARTSFDDIYDVLETHKIKLKRHFYWTKEKILNLKTNSSLEFNTSSPKTKDSFRPGKVTFDEYHAYENYDLINPAVTGLGKVDNPRRSIISTLGKIRGGPCDKLLDRGLDVLNDPEKDDNGFLYFICRLDSDDEIINKEMWPKANPSYIYNATLRREMDIEFNEYTEDPISYCDFATKRMNRPQGDKEAEVTSWNNILATNRPLPKLEKRACVWGLDYAKTNDFVAAGLLFKENENYIWISHTWVCRQSADLHRIKYPLRESEMRGELSYVDDVEISPEIVMQWLLEQMKIYNLVFGGIDHFRHTLMKSYLNKIGLEPCKKYDKEFESGNYKLVFDLEVSAIAPSILRAFNNKQIIFGDNQLMRWYVNNSKISIDKRGNLSFQKIEPKSRKTDGFFAFIAAFAVSEILDRYQNDTGGTLLPVITS